MSKYWNILSILLLLFISLSAQSDMDKFKQANELYQEEKFQEAIELYNSLLDQDYISDDLHYNLANAYFRTNKIAKAILHYEKALKINPANEDAAHNLEYANARTIDKIETPPSLFFYRWWQALIHSFSSSSWAYFVILFGLFAIAGLGIFFFFSDSWIRKTSFYSASATLALAIICWFVADRHHRSIEEADYAIIINPTVDINSSPSEGSSRLFVLHEGSKVKLKEKNQDWFEIKLPNGNTGWMKAKDLEII